MITNNRTIIIHVKKKSAFEIADALEEMGFDVDEVRKPMDTDKAQIIIKQPNNLDDFEAVATAACAAIEKNLKK